jgi:hypothetical protein
MSIHDEPESPPTFGPERDFTTEVGNDYPWIPTALLYLIGLLSGIGLCIVWNLA